MHKFTKKRIAIGALGLLVVVGVAVAYFTTQGSGTGNAEVGTSTEDITINATVGAGKLYPGTSLPLSFKVDNASQGTVYVDKVVLSEVKAYEDAAHTAEKLIPGCESKWFKMTTGSAPAEEAVAEQQIAGEASEVALTLSNGPAKLKFEDENTEQDACKNAYLVAHFTSE